jgi:drug/metabolite transporter (DMT)-like permease
MSGDPQAAAIVPIAVPRHTDRSLPPGVIALLVLLTLAWGFNWPVLKVAITEVPVWTFRGLCTASGAVGLLAIAFAARQPVRVPRRRWRPLIAISLFNITGWNVLVVSGLAEMAAGRAVILGYTMPLWATVLAGPVLGERLAPRRLAGLALGFAGMALLIADDIGAIGAAPKGALLVLGAAISWAIGVVLTKRYPIGLPAVSFAGWQMVLGGVPLAAGAVLLEIDQLRPVSAGPALATLYNMLVCFIFCYWAWNKIVNMVPVAVSGLSTLMIPVVGVLSGAAMLGERPGWREFVALVLVLGALATVLLPARGATRPAAAAD